MPYQVTFAKRVEVADEEIYINECCWGGDVVCAQLLTVLAGHFGQLNEGQEDWGWFIWLRRGSVNLAIDVYCDEPRRGAFRLHLTSRRKRWGVLDTITDTPELDALRVIVVSAVEAWAGSCVVARLDAKFIPRTSSGQE